MRVPLAAEGALEGKVAIVTGAGQGIGRAVALEFSRLGANVVLAEISPAGAEIERAIKAQGGNALFVETDVSSEQSVLEMAKAVTRHWGTVDIVVNNAIACPAVPVLEMDVATWDRVMSVNLRGTFLVSRAFLPGMIEQSEGTIVNMVSTDAMPGLSAYIASKQGIVGFTQSLAVEVDGKGVNVVAFAPGMVDTPGLRSVAPDLAPRLGVSVEKFLNVSLHPDYQGLMPAEHAAAATAFLVTSVAQEYHGEVVDGYTLLEQAGALKAAAGDVTAKAAKTGEDRTDADQTNEDLWTTAASLAARLKEVIAQTGEEFTQLPVFVRPLARRGFRDKAGMSLPEWERLTEHLILVLKPKANKEPESLPSLPELSARFTTLGPKLIEYLEGVPAQTARFTRDQKLLSEVRRKTTERVGIVQGLLSALERLPVQ